MKIDTTKYKDLKSGDSVEVVGLKEFALFPSIEIGSILTIIGFINKVYTTKQDRTIMFLVCKTQYGKEVTCCYPSIKKD